MDLGPVIIQIEDSLFSAKKLDAYERVLYWHLFRLTHVQGRESILVSIERLASILPMSEWKARETVRSLQEKGCVAIERSRKGHSIRVFLPSDLGLPEEALGGLPTDIESIDFFTGRAHILDLLRRENGRCFYCLKETNVEVAALDHVYPRVDGVDNSYRNIVVSCHDCNSRKQEQSPEDFIRSLFRRGLLSAGELEDRNASVQALREGRLRPTLK